MLFNTDLQAQRKFAIGFNGGTTGAGIEAVVRVNDRINAKLGYSGIAYDQSGDYDDLEVGIDYDGTLETSSLSLLVDFAPFKKFFRITAGVYNFSWSFNANAIPNKSYDIEGRTFEPERLGTLEANMEYESSLAPYIGVGFGNAVAKGLPVKLTLDMGLIGSGAPNFTMAGTGLIGPTADNAADFQNGLNEFEWYPVVKLGLAISFMNVNPK